MKNLPLFIALLLSTATAQNLVPNWRFDTIDVCVPRLNTPGDPYGAAHWTEENTADFFHWQCQGPGVGAPACTWGVFSPDNAFTGIVGYNWGNWGGEAIKCRLDSSVAGWVVITIRAQSAQQYVQMACGLAVIIGQDTARIKPVTNQGQWLDYKTAGFFTGDSLKILAAPPAVPLPGHSDGFSYILMGQVSVERLEQIAVPVAPIK